MIFSCQIFLNLILSVILAIESKASSEFNPRNIPFTCGEISSKVNDINPKVHIFFIILSNKDFVN